nr:type II toxin-antitoxin system HicA family toxin [Methanogenium marinum]
MNELKLANLGINALQRDGWVIVRQWGSHIRMQKNMETETLKLLPSLHIN